MYVDGIRVKEYLSKYALSTKTKRVRKIDVYKRQVLEYTVAATTVSISWSRYLVVFLEGVGINIPHALAACPWDGGIVNIPSSSRRNRGNIEQYFSLINDTAIF